MVTVEYRCEDGTPFPVHFRDEAQAAKTWSLEREHGREPATPLWQTMNDVSIPGAERCYEELGLVLPPSFRGGPDALGFAYFDEAPMSDAEMAQMFTGCGALVEKHGSALGIWHELNLPATKAAIADIDVATSFATIAELQAYAQQHTMIPAYVCGNDLTLLRGAIEGVVGAEDAGLLANELTQGFENETLRADQRLWEVAQLARRTGGAVLDALSSSDDVPSAMRALRVDGGDGVAELFAAVDAFLADYGFRAEGWDIACPTWSEQGEGFWAQVRNLADASVPEPAQAMAKGAGRRAALVAELETKFGDDEVALGRFRRRLARIEPYVAVREERAMWQVAITGAVRQAALRRGEAMVVEGALERADDVLFLTVDELDSRATVPAEVVASRRAEHSRRCGLVAPARIGGDGGDAANVGAPSSGGDERVLRGIAASRGVATGPARIIVDLADADRLEPGDVLVCVMTSPPWTALFGLASAVVVDTGDIGSHPSIAAREYGIPCVVGCRDATRSLVDGEVVTVDGAAGTVQRAAG